jgi:hypothetical protein
MIKGFPTAGRLIQGALTLSSFIITVFFPRAKIAYVTICGIYKDIASSTLIEQRTLDCTYVE